MLILTEAPRPWATDSKGISPNYYQCFCGVCLNLDTAAAFAVYPSRENLFDENSDWWRCQTTLGEIFESCRNGCCSCYVLSEGLQTFFSSHNCTADLECEVQIYMKEGKALRVDLPGFGNLEFFTNSGDDCPWGTIGSTASVHDIGSSWEGGNAQDIPIYSGSKECFRMVQTWLNDCERGHSDCQGNPRGHLPNRVLYVGRNDDFSDIFLYESQGEEEQYIALSYCWGSSRHLLTERASLQQRKDGIAWQDLPKTFQDAIKITRQIGLKFLWIDSLCIVQDDEGDWEKESSRMASTYFDAFLVIAATKGISADAGCFSNRINAHAISGTNERGDAFKIFVREPISHWTFSWGTSSTGSYYLTDDYDQLSAISVSKSQNNPLVTRAWCFQERVLARRVLHYTDKEIIWECLRGINCECGSMSGFCGDATFLSRRFARFGSHRDEPTGVELVRLKALLEEMSPDIKAQTMSINDLRHESLMILSRGNKLDRQVGDAEIILRPFGTTRTSSEQLFVYWRFVTAEYSKRRLTKDKDTLPALSGLARRVASEVTGAYYAGLWGNDMIRGMMWTAYGEEKSSDSNYLAPSWSWASSRRCIKWNVGQALSTLPQSHVKLLEVNCTIAGLDIFGRVEGGRVRLAGILVEGKVVTNKIPLTSDGCVMEWNENAYTSHFAPDSVGKIQEAKDGVIYCLRLCTLVHDSSQYERALVLSKLPNEEDVFERVGLMCNCPAGQWYTHTDIKEITII